MKNETDILDIFLEGNDLRAFLNSNLIQTEYTSLDPVKDIDEATLFISATLESIGHSEDSKLLALSPSEREIARDYLGIVKLYIDKICKHLSDRLSRTKPKKLEDLTKEELIELIKSKW